MRRVLPPAVVDELRSTGLPWGIRVGRKHWHLWLGARRVAVLSRGTSTEKGRDWRNIRATIRREARRTVDGEL